MGTSSFDTLFKAVSDSKFCAENELTCQIGAGSYRPMNGRVLRYTNNFKMMLDTADLVVSHAGIGTVFESLKMDKKLVVVANMERVDKHQQELSRYLKEHGLAVVLTKVEELDAALKAALSFNRSAFNPEGFFRMSDVLQVINDAFEKREFEELQRSKIK